MVSELICNYNLIRWLRLSVLKPAECIPPPAPTPVPAAAVHALSSTPVHALLQGSKVTGAGVGIGIGGEEKYKVKNLKESSCVVCGVERITFNTSQGE